MPAHVVLSLPDPDSAAEIGERLRADGHRVVVTPDVETALDQLREANPDVVLFAVDPTSAEGAAKLKEARARAGHSVLVAVATRSTLEAAEDALKAGADHCVSLPVDIASLRAVLRRANEKVSLAQRVHAAEEAAADQLDIVNVHRIVGAHPSMQRLLRKVLQAARSRATVLIHGETGTGKELIAAAVHENSRRAGGPYIRLNCSALAESLLESELFGHEKGSFTGASARRRGKFERAAGGTLFLDEVSEIPKPIQVKLLRFLQEREFERVGGDETIRVDVRIVAATNRDLRAMVEDGTFREDLFYRLNVVRLDVPPLRARTSDITLLAESFLRRFAEEEEKSLDGFTDQALAALLEYPWPGNVRELQNAIEQAVVLAEGTRIEPGDLPIAPVDQPALDPVQLMVPGVTMAELERYAILKTLESVGGSPTKAAKILGISRRTIQYRLQAYGIPRPK